MRPTFRLGRIAGVEVGFHRSLLAIGALLVGSLAGTMLPQAVPHAHGSYISAAVLAVVLFFGSILAHELAHSIVARRQGQTVNGITLWLLGGVSELGSEAKNANDELRVAIAGPATSITLGVVRSPVARDVIMLPAPTIFSTTPTTRTHGWFTFGAASLIRWPIGSPFPNSAIALFWSMITSDSPAPPSAKSLPAIRRSFIVRMYEAETTL
jgi:Zn-dependent protease